MTTVLKVDGVSRSFDGRQVLKDVSFAVSGGRMTGFVGANGAGKTTTMRIILGVLAADSGDVTLAGEPLTRAIRQRFGYMPEERGLYPKMTIAEQVVYLGQLHGLSRATATERTTRLLDRLGLGERAGEKLEKLSLGNQQRAQVAAALVHDPEVLFLDEPTLGLDPISRRNLWEYLVDVRARSGTTVFLTTHYLEEAEEADRVCVIDHGHVVAQGTPTQLKSQLSEDYLLIDAADRADLIAELRRLGRQFVEEQGLVRIDATGERVHLILKTIDTPLTTVRTHSPTLEDAYLRIIAAAEEQ